MIKMPLSEVLDRYTITKLKSERTSENASPSASKNGRHPSIPLRKSSSAAISSIGLFIHILVVFAKTMEGELSNPANHSYSDLVRSTGDGILKMDRDAVCVTTEQLRH